MAPTHQQIFSQLGGKVDKFILSIQTDNVKYIYNLYFTSPHN